MPTLADIFRACYAFWRLLMFDQRAIYLYPPTGAALWRSFSAYTISILLIVLGHWLSSNAYYTEAGFTFVSYALFMICQQIIGISGFYLVMHNLTARFKNRMLLPHYIIMQNWISIPLAGVYILTDLLVYMLKTSPEHLRVHLTGNDDKQHTDANQKHEQAL